MGIVTIVGGSVEMSKTAYISASDIAVGSTVKLLENGIPVDYIVVNQGIPSNSSLYDSSCDGMWLLRKDCLNGEDNGVAWGASTNEYRISYIPTYLEDYFLPLFDTDFQSVIKQVKIPYVEGPSSTGIVHQGSDGLTSKAFLLSIHEMGSTESEIFVDGGCLSYFRSSTNEKRKGYYQGITVSQWTRTSYKKPPFPEDQWMHIISLNGGFSNASVYSSCSVRPALVLPNNALFDRETFIYKGVY